jgi:CheY-like chemotaxis protein
VDASARWREVLHEHLTAWGMSCHTEASGRQALAWLASRASAGERSDVVIVGADTHELSGIEVITSMESLAELKGVPIVYLSPMAVGAMTHELPAAVVARLHKPLRMSELYACLVTASSGAPVRSRASSMPGPVPRKGQCLLVVDDDEVNQFVAGEQVAALGYDSAVASNGKQAVEAFLEGGYTAILMDCQMPVMDGYDATREIRRLEAQRESAHRIPIIALTAHALAGEREKVIAAGMDGYLTKPLRVESLKRALVELVDAQPLHSIMSPSRAPAPKASSSKPPEVDLDDTPRSAKVIELFLMHVPSQVESLAAAADAKDLGAVRAHAHKLKGSCCAIGARRMARLAERMQHLADREALDGVDLQLRALRASLDKVTRALRQAPSGQSA